MSINSFFLTLARLLSTRSLFIFRLLSVSLSCISFLFFLSLSRFLSICLFGLCLLEILEVLGFIGSFRASTGVSKPSRVPRADERREKGRTARGAEGKAPATASLASN